MLLAKGWTIVRRTIKPQTQLRIAVFMSVNMVAIVYAVIAEAQNSRTTQLVHFWQTAPGYVIIGMQLIFYFWFISTALHTMSRFKKQKRGFYVKFFLFYSGWTLCLPALMVALSQIVDVEYLPFTLFIICLLYTSPSPRDRG